MLIRLPTQNDEKAFFSFELVKASIFLKNEPSHKDKSLRDLTLFSVFPPPCSW